MRRYIEDHFATVSQVLNIIERNLIGQHCACRHLNRVLSRLVTVNSWPSPLGYRRQSYAGPNTFIDNITAHSGALD